MALCCSFKYTERTYIVVENMHGNMKNTRINKLYKKPSLTQETNNFLNYMPYLLIFLEKTHLRNLFVSHTYLNFIILILELFIYFLKGRLKPKQELPEKVSVFSDKVPNTTSHQFGHRVKSAPARTMQKFEQLISYRTKTHKELMCYD